MRNLKRVLSLAMAAAMLIGMMVVSAGAVSTYEDFTDKDEIQNTEAVNTMVSLGVINGKDDGSYFDPNGIVTRAEMAALIARCLNGGVDPSLGTGAATTQFSDTKGHWAEPYIAYCANLGDRGPHRYRLGTEHRYPGQQDRSVQWPGHPAPLRWSEP